MPSNSLLWSKNWPIMKLQNTRSAYSVTTYTERSIIKAEIANSCQWIQLLDQCLAGSRYLLSINFFTASWCAVFTGQSFVTTPGENEEVELMECEAAMSEDDEWRRRRDSVVVGLSNQWSWGRSRYLVRREGNPKWETTGTKRCPGKPDKWTI